MQAFRKFLQLRRGLFLQRDHRHFDALAARALQHEERKPPVSRDEAPAIRIDVRVGHEFSSLSRYFTMPRSALSMNVINSSTSAESFSVFLISASACEVFILERSSKRYAVLSAFKRSAENPLRSRPTALMPKLFVSRSVTTLENGGTSCVITVEA